MGAHHQHEAIRPSWRRRLQIGGVLLVLFLTASLVATIISPGHAHPPEPANFWNPDNATPIYVYQAVSDKDKAPETDNTPVAPETDSNDKAIASQSEIAEPIFETPELPQAQSTKSETPKQASKSMKPAPTAAKETILPPHLQTLSDLYTKSSPSIVSENETPTPTASPQTITVTETVYEDLPGIWVLPIPNPTAGRKAFADAAWSIGAEVARQLEIAHPNTTIYYPAESIATLKRRQPALLYRLWEQWNKEGHFHQAAINHALDTLTPNTPPIARVVVVEADTDFNEPEKTRNIIDRFRVWHGDDLPDHIQLQVRSRLTVLDTLNPTTTRVWTGAWQHPIRRNKVLNMTASVYDDTDSHKAFHDAGQIIGKVLRTRAPKAAFTKPVTVTSTRVVAKKGK